MQGVRDADSRVSPSRQNCARSLMCSCRGFDQVGQEHGKIIAEYQAICERCGQLAAKISEIYLQFLKILETIEKPSLIHYGSFETEFLKQMGARYGTSVQAVLENNGNHSPTNL